MKRSEQRELQRALERRILGGERKADIVGRAAADGADWQAYARTVARIPTPANRLRWRWLNRALMTALVASAAGQAAGAVVVAGGWLWLTGQLLLTISLLAPSAWVAHYRQDGYSLASGAGISGLGWWLYVVAYGHEYSAPGALIAAESALCALVVALSLLALHLLLPATQWWETKPKIDAAGNLIFEE